MQCSERLLPYCWMLLISCFDQLLDYLRSNFAQVCAPAQKAGVRGCSLSLSVGIKIFCAL